MTERAAPEPVADAARVGPPMCRLFGLLGAAFAGLAVAGGAFGAHALKDTLSAEHLAVFETAVRYQAMHALALLVVGLWLPRDPRRSLRVAGWAFVIGIALFSGSLYALALTGVRAFGAVTPAGGVAFLVGWAALAIAAVARDPADR